MLRIDRIRGTRSPHCRNQAARFLGALVQITCLLLASSRGSASDSLQDRLSITINAHYENGVQADGHAVAVSHLNSQVWRDGDLHNGFLTISRLAPGTYDVMIVPSDKQYIPFMLLGLVLPVLPDQAIQVNFHRKSAIPTGVTLAGEVDALTTEQLATAEIKISCTAGEKPEKLTKALKPDGKFEFLAQPCSNYSFEIWVSNNRRFKTSIPIWDGPIRLRDGDAFFIQARLETEPAASVGKISIRIGGGGPGNGAQIRTTVVDALGAAVVGAKVTVSSGDLERVSVTGQNGAVVFEALLPGTYVVTVSANGFQPRQIDELNLGQQEADISVPLSVASAQEAVTVSAAAPTIDVTTMTVGQTISQRTVQDIPLNGRHFVDLGLLVPGSVTAPQNGFLPAPVRGQGAFAFNTSGNREDTVNFMVNGINLNDMVQNQITFQPSVGTISAFRVDNSTHSAEYGHNSGAAVNIITRSGTNSYHGELSEFTRNNALDARNFFNTTIVPQAPFRRNQFGANLGGPIMKQKTFFFVSYEGFRQRQAISLNTRVLTSAERQQIVAANNSTSILLLQAIPLANDPTGARFLGSDTAPVDTDQGSVDISHSLTESVRFHGYYAMRHDLRREPTQQGNSVPGFGDTRESTNQIGTFSVDQVFSANVVNEARLGLSHIHSTVAPNATQNPVSMGILDGKDFNSGLPQITVGGTDLNIGGPSSSPQRRSDMTAVLSDTLSYVLGKHSLKFGGEFRRFYNDNFASDTGTLGFLDLRGFANGTPNAFSLSPGNISSRIATGALGFFAQDNWRLLNRLTVELGVRYDWNQTPTEAFHRFVNFIPATDSLVQTGLPYRQNNLNVQPRVGFAWDVFGNSKTVFRSGYAVQTDQPVTNIVTALANNPPLGDPLAFVASLTTPTTSYASLLADARASGLSPVAVDPHFQNSYIHSYNLNIQQQIASKWTLMAGYFGSLGRHLRTRENLNQLTDGLRPFPNLSVSSPILPGAALGNISDNVSNGNSSYNSFWINSNLNAWRGLQFNASYAYSKSLDYTSQNSQDVVLQDSFDPRGDKGLSDFDVRNRFSMSLIYDLPLRGNRLVEGWQVGSVIQLQSGNPVNLVLGGFAEFTGLATLRPDEIGPVRIVNQPSGGGIQWFAPLFCDPTKANGPACNRASFAVPVGGGVGGFHLGNFGRNVIIGPGFNDLDFSIRKITIIGEHLRIQLGLDAYNLFNHPNLGQPGAVAQLIPDSSNPTQLIVSPTFGVIHSTRFPIGESGSARQLQFGIKLLF